MFTPLEDRILVKPDTIAVTEEVESKVIPGLVGVKQNFNETDRVATTGTVVITGPGRYEAGELVPCSVKTGDKIMWGKYGGSNLIVDGEEMLLMRNSDITGIIT